MQSVKVGDLLVGIAGNGYGLTNEECLIEVVSVNDTERVFSAKVVAHKSKAKEKNCVNKIFDALGFDEFEVPTQEQINSIKGIKAPKEKPSKSIHFGNLRVDFYSAGIESNFNKEFEMKAESEQNRIDAFNKIKDNYNGQKSIYDFKEVINLNIFDDILNPKQRKEALAKMINFFMEFQFAPNFRFVNTLAHKLANGVECGKAYIANYFALSGSTYAEAVVDKMKSEEFGEIVAALAIIEPANYINKRLKVYYGDAGSGKTTKALSETEGRCIVCNGSMLPDDLLQDFKFNDGKPGFSGSMLRECLEKGKKITLDEFNLLPMETLRFLQGLTDLKSEFIYKGETIKIADGFEVIGTMNLTVNGMTFGLPEPIVDRCSDIQKYTLTANDLMAALE